MLFDVRRLPLTATTVLLLLLSTRAGMTSEVEFEDNQLVCAVNAGVSIDSINARYGTETEAILYPGGALAVSYLLSYSDDRSEDSLADAIALDLDVLYCTPNYLLGAPEPVQRSQPFLDVSAETEVINQPAAQRLQLSTAQAQSTGSDVTVAVIDAGVDASQPMLTGSVLPGLDYVDADSLSDDEPGGPASGHGTFVAGIIHLVAPDALILPYRVIDTLGRGNGFNVARAVIHAVGAGARVINISLAMSGKHPSLDDAIEYARDHDVLVVAAAGNDSAEAPRFPADDSYALGVAAVDSLDIRSAYSNYGSHIDLCAPGNNIRGPFLDTVFARWNGTSFAAPFVAGAGALLYALRPQASWGDIVEALEVSAEDIDSINPAFEGKLGAGIVNPVSAVASWWVDYGDVNGTGEVNSSDIIFLINFVFKSGPAPTNPDAADVNASCDINASDVIYLVNYVFKGGPAPQPGCVP